MDDLGALTARDRKPNRSDISKNSTRVTHMVEGFKFVIASGVSRSRCSNDALGVAISPFLSSAFYCVGFPADQLFQGKVVRRVPVALR